jgi:hypothetical protein
MKWPCGAATQWSFVCLDKSYEMNRVSNIHHYSMRNSIRNSEKKRGKWVHGHPWRTWHRSGWSLAGYPNNHLGRTESNILSNTSSLASGTRRQCGDCLVLWTTKIIIPAGGVSHKYHMHCDDYIQMWCSIVRPKLSVIGWRRAGGTNCDVRVTCKAPMGSTRTFGLTHRRIRLKGFEFGIYTLEGKVSTFPIYKNKLWVSWKEQTPLSQNERNALL